MAFEPLEPPVSSVSTWGWKWIKWVATLYAWLIKRATYQTNIGSVTLTPGTTTTVVTDGGCLTTSAIFLCPQASGAGMGANSIYISAVGVGSFTITHSNSASTTRTLFYLIVNE